MRTPYQRLLKDIEERRKNAKRRYEQGIISKEQYERFIHFLDKKEKELKTKENELNWDNGRIVKETIKKTIQDIQNIPSTIAETTIAKPIEKAIPLKLIIFLIVIIILIYVIKKK